MDEGKISTDRPLNIGIKAGLGWAGEKSNTSDSSVRPSIRPSKYLSVSPSAIRQVTHSVHTWHAPHPRSGRRRAMAVCVCVCVSVGVSIHVNELC
mmetsp:Transcript_10357/g.29911  ORF Transcript_10357/g.29911 Transcript_10357/m.29911 type:complete len:95 (+) Transcript_10357:329-613(+)